MSGVGVEKKPKVEVLSSSESETAANNAVKGEAMRSGSQLRQEPSGASRAESTASSGAWSGSESDLYNVLSSSGSSGSTSGLGSERTVSASESGERERDVKPIASATASASFAGAPVLQPVQQQPCSSPLLVPQPLVKQANASPPIGHELRVQLSIDPTYELVVLTELRRDGVVSCISLLYVHLSYVSVYARNTSTSN